MTDVYYDRRYAYYKDRHICVQCRDAKAVEGKVLCEACAVISRKRAREQYIKRGRQEVRELNRKYRETRKLLGLCTRCGGKKEPGDTRQYCRACRIRAHELYIKKRYGNYYERYI